MNAGRMILVILIVTSCFLHKAAGQSVSPKAFKILNAADGLPQSFISGLLQDPTGFIWIGTRDGLARYDGKKFKIFRNVPGDTATLANNTITDFFLDKHSNLWIAYETGDIDILNTETESLFHFTKDSVYTPVYAALKTGHSIAEDATGTIWLLSNKNGVFACNLSKRTLHFYSTKDLRLPNHKIGGMAVNGDQIILITDTALVTCSKDLKLLQIVPYPFDHPLLDSLDKPWKNVPSVFRKNGDMVIMDESRLIIYHPATRAFTILPLPQRKKEFNFCITRDDKGRVFFEHDYIIYVLSPDNTISTWLPKDPNAAFGFKSILIDRSGVLWLGGNGSGIHLHDLRLSRLQGTPYEKSFHEDILQKYLQVPPVEIKKTFLYNMQPYRFRWLQDRNGKTWFSKAVNDPAAQPQLCYYQHGHLVQPSWYYTDTFRNRHINISAIAQSKTGKLWGVDFFLRPVYFDTLSGAVTVYPPIASINTEHTYTVNSLLIDGEDIFWISTALRGLYCYNKKTGTTVHYSYSNSPGSLPTNQLMNLVQDSVDANILWMGSLGGGLIQFNKTTGKCRVYSTSEGLPNNTVYAVLMDARGILWCSSNKGIFSFHPKTGAIRSFTSKDGLPGDEFNRYHFLQLPDGRIAFGGVDGYTVFNPLTIADDSFQPSIALTGIRINNMPADYGYPASPFEEAINSLDKIVLPYHQNFLSFEFSALEYNISEKLQYRYQLEDLDAAWVHAGNDNIATYTKVPPGHYVLKINATNTAGKWSSHIKTLSVIIQPPFWKTWWFTLLWILGLVALIYFLIRSRIAHVRTEEQQKAKFEREAADLKAQALRAQMNPHFIFNCLNSIKALIQEDNKMQAVNYLTTFSKLIRNQLNNAKQEVSLHEELETCRLYTKLEALRFGSSIICEFDIGEDVDTHSVQVPPLILQPFIENAIWHGILPKGGGNVKVSVTCQDNNIQCTIEDDGVGRETSLLNKSQRSGTYQSKGMKLVQGRLNLHNIIHNQGGSIELIDKKGEDGKGSGTLVIVNF